VLKELTSSDMEENKMKKHITAIAILQIVFGAFNLIGGMVVAFVFNFAGSFVTEPIATKVLSYISVPLTVMLCLFGALMLIGAIGLFSYKNWARILTLIMGGLGLLNIPLGTLKGVYIIWALVQPESVALFEGTKPAQPVQ
jgi:hypothetical protein